MLLTSAAVMSPSKFKSTTSRCPSLSACTRPWRSTRTNYLRDPLHASVAVLRPHTSAGRSLKPTLLWRSFFAAAFCRRAANLAVICSRWAARSSSVMLALRACQAEKFHRGWCDQTRCTRHATLGQNQSAVSVPLRPILSQTRHGMHHLRLSAPSLQCGCPLCLLVSFTLRFHFLPPAQVTR